MQRWIYNGKRRRFIRGRWFAKGNMIDNPTRPTTEFTEIGEENTELKNTDDLNFDINNDGKVDSEDMELMAKTAGKYHGKKGGRPRKNKGDKK